MPQRGTDLRASLSVRALPEQAGRDAWYVLQSMLACYPTAVCHSGGICYKAHSLARREGLWQSTSRNT